MHAALRIALAGLRLGARPLAITIAATALSCSSAPSAPADAEAAAKRAETIARIQPGSVRVGEPLPDLSFESLGGAPVALSSLRGMPSVLVFGSCTCGPFVESMAAIAELEREYRGRASFLLVYIDEAHPTDGWVMPGGAFELARPRSIAERRAAAEEFRRRLSVGFPIVLEPMDRSAERTFGAFPNRLVIADAGGTVVANGKPGPFSTAEAVKSARGTLDALIGSPRR